MNSRIISALVLPFALVAPAPASAQSQAGSSQSGPSRAALSQAADLERVQAHLRAVRSMTADFSQTDRQGQVLTGAVTLRQPGRIRFQYQEGVPLLIVGDGQALTMIDYQVRQVQRWPIGNSPLSVLLDPSQDLTRFGRVMPTGDPRILSVEARDPGRPELGVITMAFAREASAPGGLRLQGWVALDSQNNRTTVRLSNQRYNVAVPDSAFRWTDPRRAPRGGR